MAAHLWLGSLLLVLGRATTATDYFNDPHRVCTLLESEGLVTGGWNSVAYGYECSTEGQVRKNAPPHSPASFIADGYITYTASGDDDRRVRRIKLIVYLTPPGEDTASRKAEFLRIATILCQRLGRRIPAALRKSIYKETQYREEAPTGNLTFDPGRGRAPHKELLLTIRDPSVRVVPIPRGPEK